MKKILYTILAILSLFTSISEIFAGCSIDGRLSPKLVAYEKGVSDALNTLKTAATLTCGVGVVKSANKSIEVIDRALLQVPIHGDIITDFEYNITMALQGESRTAVQRNGEIFQKLQKKIIQTIDSLSASCNLTNVNEEKLVKLSQTNYLLESVYKTVSVGGKAEGRDQLREIYEQEAFDEIRDTYNPTATASCKNEYDYENKISTLIESFSKGTFGIENAYADWYQAIALFSGRSNNGLYKDVARKLLIKELNHQGLSKNNQSIIVGNFDCAKKEETGEDDMESKAKAIAKCREIEVSGLDNIIKAAEDLLSTSPNTVVYIDQVMKNKEIIFNMTSVADMHKKYSSQASNQTPVNESMLSSLVSLHIELLSINKMLEKRIPVQQKNCMKALPEIVGGCRKDG